MPKTIMNEAKKIITIDKLETSPEKAKEEFARFMLLAQECFNSHSKNDPHYYAKRKPHEIEYDTVSILDEVKSATAFVNSQIELRSRHFFPDIITGAHYGVEVKTTKEDKWYSLGNSIFEGVSDNDIKNIYLMFGNLGSTPPEFRFRPYEDCIKNIAVTHSPRYIIDMEIADGDKNTIFNKMNTTYEKYKIMPDNLKVELMRAHYLKNQNGNKPEMPWWIGGVEGQNKLSFFGDAEVSEKEDMIARALILFPRLYHSRNDKHKYKNIALWLCTKYGKLLYNVRDSFSASGQANYINGVKLERPYPKIAKTVLDYRPKIQILLDAPDEELQIDIKEMWNFNYKEKDLYSSWIEMVAKEFKNNKEISFIDIKKHLQNEDIAK